jgi:hypothetical protein
VPHTGLRIRDRTFGRDRTFRYGSIWLLYRYAPGGTGVAPAGVGVRLARDARPGGRPGSGHVGPSADPELRVGACQVVLDSSLSDEQCLGDLVFRRPGRRELRDPQFAGSKRIARTRSASRRGLRPAIASSWRPRSASLRPPCRKARSSPSLRMPRAAAEVRAGYCLAGGLARSCRGVSLPRRCRRSESPDVLVDIERDDAHPGPRRLSRADRVGASRWGA